MIHNPDTLTQIIPLHTFNAPLVLFSAGLPLYLKAHHLFLFLLSILIITSPIKSPSKNNQTNRINLYTFPYLTLTTFYHSLGEGGQLRLQGS